MPKKTLPNGVVIYDHLSADELSSFGRGDPSAGGAPLPARAIKDRATSVTVTVSTPPSDPATPAAPDQP